MRVEISDAAPTEVEADLLCYGLFEGDELQSELAGLPGAGDVRSAFKKLTMLRPERPRRALVIGLGQRTDFDPERARVAAALGVRQARRYEATTVAWAVPGGGEAPIAAALVEGTILAGYRFDRFKSGSANGEDESPTAIETLRLIGAPGNEAAVEIARVASEAANRTRELQDLPGNVANPAYLADRAREIAAAHEAVSVEVLDRERLSALGMGGMLAVAAGSANEPAMIVLRHSAGAGPPLGMVGKAVTFDTGGISIKPSASMHEMKMDMSGGAAVLEATAAIAELGLGVDLIAVVPAVENMPSGTATRPGDIITQLNGKTVEVNNTDAEGRLILADALTYCAREGAERIVDLATLTGAVLVALGSTYAALLANDDEWADRVRDAGAATGELAWRLPLHPEYKELVRGSVADLVNVSGKRKAGTIYAASFLEEFVEGARWAHLDIAGTAWDVGREYVGKGATGFGTRLLIELARRHADR